MRIECLLLGGGRGPAGRSDEIIGPNHGTLIKRAVLGTRGVECLC
mgnify:CR=1 FL=1